MMPVISGVDGYSNTPVSVKTRSGSFTYGFKSPELPVGTVLSVMVTHVTDPEYFHCQGTKYAAAFGHLADKIHIHYSKLQPEDETLKLISPGQPCVAQYSADKLWYRAKVNRELSDGDVEVFFVDYGNVEVVSRHLIKVTKPDFMEMPAQGILCTLDGISNVHGYWSPEHIAKFEDMVLEQFFTAKVKSFGQNGIHSVELSKEGENFQINLVFGRLTGTLCLEEDSDSSLRSVTVGRDRTNLQVTVESDSRNRRTPPKVWSMNKNTKSRRDGFQDSDLLRDDGASSSDSQSFASCASDTSVCYKSFKFPIGSQLDVCMIFLISPHEFWCQPLSMGNKLKTLMKDLNDKNSGATRLEFEGIPSSKTPCLAKFSDDRMWYRAEVVEVKQGKAAVFYVDYGNAEILPLSELRVLQSRYAEVPTLAVKCCLNLDPKSVWSDTRINRLQELALDKRLSAKVLSRMGGTYVLELYDPSVQKNLVSIVEDKDLLHQLPINNDMNLRVNVSWVTSPDDFWLHMANNERLLDNMVQEMQDYYDIAKEKYTECPSVGASVVAQFSEDKAWYRANVEEVFGSKVRVRFVDFGNEEMISLSDLRPLIPIFVQCPCQAVRCRLLDVKPLSMKGWTPDAKDFLENLKGELICTFKKLVKNIFHVEIREDGHSVAERMVNAGLASPMDMKLNHAPEMNRQPSFRGLLTFKVIEVLPNQVKSVMISHCNGLTDFWCQMAGFTDELNNLMDELAIEYDTSNMRSVGNRPFHIGSPCIAKYSEDDTWYRAIVVDNMAGKFTVQFVDYGNSEAVTPTNMRQMTSKFMRLPKLAVPCKLYGIHSSSAHQDDTFTELVLEKTMKAQFFNGHPSDGVYEVNLLQDDGVSVLESLEGCIAANGSDPKMLGLSNGTLEIPIIPVNQKLAQGHSKIGSVCFSYSPDHFFIHFEEDDDKIDEASEMLNAEYSQDIWTDKSLTHIEQGMICCAKYSVDNQWYRACVLENNGDLISVCFLDYGNSENVSAQNLRPLLEVFCDMPALAYKFGLAGILPMENEWSQEVCDLFERIVVDETWTIRNMGKNECLLVSDENGNNVLDLLVNSGHARKKEADFSTSKDAKATKQPSSVLLPSKIYLDVIFEKLEDLSPENRSLADILFIPDIIFPSVDVPSDEIQCCITHLTESLRPGIFYLRLASQDEKYSDLSMTLCNKLTNYSNPVLEVNTLCCVYLAESKNMCRGVITSVDKSVVGLVDVKSIDSGHYLRDVPVSSIRGISDEARTVPPLAYPCVLDNCTNWNERMRSRFHLLTNGRNLMAHFKSTTRPYIVELLDESGDKISDAISGKMTTINKETNSDESVLKPFHVLQHETLGIYISHIVTPEDFWCQPEESVDLLDKLEKEMNAYCTQGAGKERGTYSDDLKAGTLCIVHFAKDDQFYRGKIQSLKRFSCDVLFVDYGYTETVEKKSIWPMQSEFLELPAQAFECRLAKIQSKDGSWSKNSLEVFQDLCLTQLMIARVINSLQHPDGTGYVIDLILKGRSVADLLVEQNVADNFSKVELVDNVLVERSIINAIAETHFLSSPKVLMKGESLRIQVCHIDTLPHKFWVQILTKVPLIERLGTLLGDVYGNLASKPASLEDLKVGMLCAVINSSGCPYRGCVQNIADDNSTCSVLNIDSGTTETVECGCLKELYTCFKDFSPQAFHCELSTSDDDVVLSEGWIGCLKVDAIADDGHYLVTVNQDLVPCSLPMYLQPEYVEGFATEAVVCFTTDPGDFWCQFKESAGLDYLMGKLKYLFKNDENITIPESELRVGLPCVARYSEDGALYRAEVLVLDIDTSSAQVMFCDYGNVEHVALSDLKPAPSELLTLPKQAFHCCLSGADPITGEEWTDDMRSGFEEIVAEKVFDLSISSVSEDEDGKYMVNMKHKNEKCLLEMLIKCGIAKDPFSLPEIDSKDQVNSPNYGSAVELSASEKELSESEEYKDISQASEEFGSDEFHDALHGNDPLKLADQNSNLKGDISSDVHDLETENSDISKNECCSVKQSNTMDSGLVADCSFSSENSLMKASSDLEEEDDNVLDYNSNSTTNAPSDNLKDETDEMKIPESTDLTVTNQKHVIALPAPPSLEIFDSNHNDWEDMDRDIKIENILTRLETSQSFDLDSTFGDSDTETISPFTDWPLETGLRLKAFMLHCTSPDHFYMRLCSMAEERVKLFSAIENCVPKLEPAQEKDFLSGSACVAKCSGDAEVWQRCIIQDEEIDAVKVFFVDTGKEEKLPKNSVRRCPLSLFCQPILSVSCFLTDIQPLNGSWTTAACDLFKELTHNISLELKAEVRSGNRHGIYLYKEGDDEAINDRFVDLGYASAETGSKLEVNRELQRSLLDPHRTEHMDIDCDTLDHHNSHGHFLFEDSIKGSADDVTNITRLKQNVTEEKDETKDEVMAEQRDEDVEKTDQDQKEDEIDGDEEESDEEKDEIEEKDVSEDALEDDVPDDKDDDLEDVLKDKDVPEEKDDLEDALKDKDVPKEKDDLDDNLEDKDVPEKKDDLEDKDVPEKKDDLEDKDVPEKKDDLEDKDVPEKKDDLEDKDVPEKKDELEDKDVPKDGLEDSLEDKDVPEDGLKDEDGMEDKDKEDALEDKDGLKKVLDDAVEDEKDIQGDDGGKGNEKAPQTGQVNEHQESEKATHKSVLDD